MSFSRSIFPRSVQAVLAFHLVLAATPVAASDLCVRMDLEQPPHWVNEAVWLPDQDELMISDMRRRQISTFAADGAVVETVGFDDGQPPYAILPFGTDFLFINHRQGIDWVSHGLGETESLPLNLGDTRSSAWQVQRIWSKQTVIAGETLVAMGGLVKEDQLFLGAFAVRLPGLTESVTEIGSPRPILEFVPPPSHESNAGRSPVPEMLRFDPQRTPFYTQSMRFVASIGTRAYMLVLEDDPVVVAYNTASQHATIMGGFPWKGGLPARSTGTPAERYSYMASLDFPAGLYANDGALYALRRTPRKKEGGTLWRLTKLVPSGTTLHAEGTVVLPTTSEHISLLPSSDGWFVIEEGDVYDRPSPSDPNRKIGYKDVQSVVVVPNDSIEMPGRSDLAEGRYEPGRACRVR